MPSMAWPPAMVRVLAPFLRSPCQMRPAPRSRAWALITLRLRRQHLADVAVVDQIARVHQGRVAAGLQADDRLEPALFRELCHLFCLGQVGAEGPLAEDGLVRFEAGHDEVLVAGHADDDGDEVDLRVLGHLVDVGEGVLGAELLLRCLGGLLARRADGDELVVFQDIERGDVGVGAPAAAALRHRRADDTDANLVSHCVFSSRNCHQRCFGFARDHALCAVERKPSWPAKDLPRVSSRGRRRDGSCR